MNAPRNIVFLAVNSSYSHSSLAASCLRSFVDSEQWTWHTVEATTGEDVHDVLARVTAYRPAVLAVTLYLFNRPFVLSLLRRYKALAPECVVIVGGPECLGDNRALIADGRTVDAAVRGEGERALPALLDRIDTRYHWREVPGLCAVVDGWYADGGQAEALPDLDDMPPFYDAYLAGFTKPFVQLETSRGCANACSFCTSAGTPVRRRSLARVRSDLEVIRRQGIREVRVVDRTFNADPRRALELVRMFRDECPGIQFHLEVDPAPVSTALIDELKQAPAGRFHIEAGVQCLNAGVYRNIRRKASVRRTSEGLARLCACRNIAVHVDLMAGLPGGTWLDLRADVQRLVAMRPGDIQLERLKLLPGTPLDLEQARWGIVSAAEPPYEVLQTPHMRAEDLWSADKLSKLIDWFYNVPALQDVIIESNGTIADFWRGLESVVERQTGFATCPSLEGRFRLLDEFLGQRGSPLVHRLRYAWLRRGFSARHGLCPATPWKQAIPPDAVLVEGDPAAVVARKWLVELDQRYLFAYGADDHGGRAVVAVWKLGGVV